MLIEINNSPMEVPDELGQFLIRAGAVRHYESDGHQTALGQKLVTERKQPKSPKGLKAKATKLRSSTITD